MITVSVLILLNYIFVFYRLYKRMVKENKKESFYYNYLNIIDFADTFYELASMTIGIAFIFILFCTLLIYTTLYLP